MEISKHIDSYTISNNLLTVNNLLKKAEATVSFFGERVITVNGYEGSFSLDELASRVALASEKCLESNDLTTEERVAGIDILYKIRNFYQVTDTKISETNCFTKLLNWIREFTFYPYTPRHYTKEHGLTEQYFRAYSEDNFVKTFGEEKPNGFDYENSDGYLIIGVDSSTSLILVKATETAIRNLLLK